MGLASAKSDFRKKLQALLNCPTKYFKKLLWTKHESTTTQNYLLYNKFN